MTEVLEHLDDPHGLLRRVKSDYLVASVPVHETETDWDGKHCWVWDVEGFGELLFSNGWTPVETLFSPVSQTVLARRKR